MKKIKTPKAKKIIWGSEFRCCCCGYEGLRYIKYQPIFVINIGQNPDFYDITELCIMEQYECAMCGKRSWIKALTFVLKETGDEKS